MSHESPEGKGGRGPSRLSPPPRDARPMVINIDHDGPETRSHGPWTTHPSNGPLKRRGPPPTSELKPRQSGHHSISTRMCSPRELAPSPLSSPPLSPGPMPHERFHMTLYRPSMTLFLPPPMTLFLPPFPKVHGSFLPPRKPTVFASQPNRSLSFHPPPGVEPSEGNGTGGTGPSVAPSAPRLRGWL